MHPLVVIVHFGCGQRPRCASAFPKTLWVGVIFDPWEDSLSRPLTPLRSTDTACMSENGGMRKLLPTLIAMWIATPATAAEPLHKRIDKLILAAAKGHAVAQRSSDTEFCRRIYLDFAGRIPTAAQVRQFIRDKSQNKRTKLIDRLMNSPEYVRRMSELFHVILIERRGDHDEWQAFLRNSFSKNKPWNQIAREILSPDAADEKTRGSALFYTTRLKKYGQNPTDYPGLTRDITRLFLGKDLQCAQCHNHLFIKDYRQLDFQGLYSVYLQTSIFGGKFPAINERRMMKKHSFVSVFDPTQRATGPRIPSGKEITIPPLPKTKKKPKKKPVGPKRPKFSAVALVAGEMTRPTNADFARNIVNRMWFVMMGRGIVHPLDLHHSENKPSHPQVLKLMADEFVKHKFDLKWLWRELAMSETYQRSSRLGEGKKLPTTDRFTVFAEKRLSAEQLLWSFLTALEIDKTIAPGLAKGTPKKNDKLTELNKIFLEAFANPAREAEDEIRPTVKGALFLSNDEKLLTLLDDNGKNLTARLTKTKDDKKLIEEAFLSVYSRLPSKAESKTVKQFIKEAGPRKNAAKQLVWALLSSAEFFTNH